jgi:hypothetical protein
MNAAQIEGNSIGEQQDSITPASVVAGLDIVERAYVSRALFEDCTLVASLVWASLV